MSTIPLPLTMTSANEIVVSQIDRLNDLADDLIRDTSEALSYLQTSYINTAELDPRLFWSDADLDAILNHLGQIPSPDLSTDWLNNVNLPEAGPEFVFDPAVRALVQGQLPVYNMPPMPTFPAMPEEPADPGEPTAIPAPHKPTIPYVDEPDITVNETSPVYTDYTGSIPFPVMRPITLPDPPVLVLDTIQFEGVRPVFDIEVPDLAQYQFTPGVYEPLMMTEIQEAIQRVLQGGTGINPEIESALFERAREREVEVGNRDIDTVSNEYAAKNYKYPPGALSRRIDRVRGDASLKISQINRDQFIEQWRIEVEQFRAVLGSAIALEEVWLRVFSEGERLRFEAAKAQLDFALQVFNAQIAAINAEAQLYAIDAQVYRDRIAAEEAKINAYAAELQAQKLIGDLNAQDVAVYVERIKALMANAEIYRARVEGYVAKFKEVDARLSLYREKLQGNVTIAQIYETDVRAFGVMNEAQKSRDERFRVKAEIFSTKTEAKKTEFDALLAAYNQNFKIAELERDTFIANGERVREMIAAESARIEAVVQRYQGMAAQLTSKSEVERTRYTLLLSHAQAQVERMKAAADILMKNGEINIQSALQAQNLTLRARETAATTLAQLAAGLTAAANVNASISNTYGNSIGYSYNGELDIA